MNVPQVIEIKKIIEETPTIKTFIFDWTMVGENINGDYLEYLTSTPMTQKGAKKYAEYVLISEGGGHLDCYTSETNEFIFDVEV